jgi:hypothetical protein
MRSIRSSVDPGQARRSRHSGGDGALAAQKKGAPAARPSTGADEGEKRRAGAL